MENLFWLNAVSCAMPRRPGLRLGGDLQTRDCMPWQQDGNQGPEHTSVLPLSFSYFTKPKPRRNDAERKQSAEAGLSPCSNTCILGSTQDLPKNQLTKRYPQLGLQETQWKTWYLVSLIHCGCGTFQVILTRLLGHRPLCACEHVWEWVRENMWVHKREKKQLA